MNVALEISGGFAPTPGLSLPYSVDTTVMDPARASEIESIVLGTNFFNLPARINSSAGGAADYFVYKITVKDGDRNHSVVLTDPVSDQGLERLIEILKASPRSK